MTLGEFIRQKRTEADVSLSEMARRLGLTPPFLSDIELGRRNPSEVSLRKIAAYFKLPIEELKKFDDRVSFSDLKRLIEKDPRLGVAFRTTIEDIREGRSSTDELIKKLTEQGEGE